MSAVAPLPGPPGGAFVLLLPVRVISFAGVVDDAPDGQGVPRRSSSTRHVVRGLAPAPSPATSARHLAPGLDLLSHSLLPPLPSDLSRWPFKRGLRFRLSSACNLPAENARCSGDASRRR